MKSPSVLAGPPIPHTNQHQFNRQQHSCTPPPSPLSYPTATMPKVPTVTPKEVRAWCRGKYGDRWYDVGKTKKQFRKAEARANLMKAGNQDQEHQDTKPSTEEPLFVPLVPKPDEQAQALMDSTTVTCKTAITCHGCKTTKKAPRAKTGAHAFVVNIGSLTHHKGKAPDTFTYNTNYPIGCSHTTWDGESWCDNCMTYLINKDGDVRVFCTHCAGLDWGKVAMGPVPQSGWTFYAPNEPVLPEIQAMLISN